MEDPIIIPPLPAPADLQDVADALNGRWTDRAARMHAVVERLRAVLPGPAWRRPERAPQRHMLVWGYPPHRCEHAEDTLEELIAWCDETWPDHDPEPVDGTAYVADGPLVGRPASLPYEGHSPATAHCGACERILLHDGYGPEGRSGEPKPWRHSARRAGDGARM